MGHYRRRIKQYKERCESLGVEPYGEFQYARGEHAEWTEERLNGDTELSFEAWHTRSILHGVYDEINRLESSARRLEKKYEELVEKDQ